MANAKRERPFVLQWRSAVLNSSESASVKLSLLALAEFANSNGGDCVPGFPALANMTSQSEKTCRRAMEDADGQWFSRVPVKLSGKDWRAYSYTLRMPEGADTVTAGSRKGADTVTGANTGRSGHSGGKVRTLAPDGAVTVSTVLGKAPRNKAPRSKGKLTFGEWIESVHNDDEKAIPSGHRVFSYAEEIGLPDEFLYLGWCAFRERMRDSGKRQADWRHTFLNYVKNPSWLGVWYVDGATHEYRLTSAGLQLKLSLDAAEQRAA